LGCWPRRHQPDSPEKQLRPGANAWPFSFHATARLRERDRSTGCRT
jgi:hypothetical protein